MTAQDLQQELDIVLNRIRQDQFGGREAPFVSLHEGTGPDRDGRFVGVFNGRRAVDFRRRILADQGSMDICRLCSGYGMPTMHREKPSTFSIVRHTSSTDLDAEIAAASKYALRRQTRGAGELRSKESVQ